VYANGVAFMSVSVITHRVGYFHDEVAIAPYPRYFVTVTTSATRWRYAATMFAFPAPD
jgi:hypothetical protein